MVRRGHHPVLSIFVPADPAGGTSLLIPGVIAAVPIAGLAGVILFAAITPIEPKEGCTPAVPQTGDEHRRGLHDQRGRVRDPAGRHHLHALSIAEFMARLARPHDGVLGFVPDVAGMHDVDDNKKAVTIPGLVVFRYDAPLFFPQRLRLYNKVEEAATPARRLR